MLPGSCRLQPPEIAVHAHARQFHTGGRRVRHGLPRSHHQRTRVRCSGHQPRCGYRLADMLIASNVKTRHVDVGHRLTFLVLETFAVGSGQVVNGGMEIDFLTTLRTLIFPAKMISPATSTVLSFSRSSRSSRARRCPAKPSFGEKDEVGTCWNVDECGPARRPQVALLANGACHVSVTDGRDNVVGSPAKVSVNRGRFANVVAWTGSET